MNRHECYVCSGVPGRPEVRREGDGWGIHVPPRFSGPPDSVNGGIAVGLLSCPALQLAADGGRTSPQLFRITCRLHAPVPLDRTFRGTARAEDADGRYVVEAHDQDRALLSASVLVASGPPDAGGVIQNPPAGLQAHLSDFAGLADASPEGPTMRQRELELEGGQMFGGCFSCGPDNPTGLHLDGRQIGPHEIWSRWDPAPDFIDRENVLAATLVSSALDCSSAHCTKTDTAFMRRQLERQITNVLGTFDLWMLRVPPMEVPGGYRVLARFLDHEGRKVRSMSALLDRDGVCYAVADAIWIEIPRASLAGD